MFSQAIALSKMEFFIKFCLLLSFATSGIADRKWKVPTPWKPMQPLEFLDNELKKVMPGAFQDVLSFKNFKGTNTDVMYGFNGGDAVNSHFGKPDKKEIWTTENDTHVELNIKLPGTVTIKKSRDITDKDLIGSDHNLLIVVSVRLTLQKGFTEGGMVLKRVDAQNYFHLPILTSKSQCNIEVPDKNYNKAAIGTNLNKLYSREAREQVEPTLKKLPSFCPQLITASTAAYKNVNAPKK